MCCYQVVRSLVSIIHWSGWASLLVWRCFRIPRKFCSVFSPQISKRSIFFVKIHEGSLGVEQYYIQFVWEIHLFCELSFLFPILWSYIVVFESKSSILYPTSKSKTIRCLYWLFRSNGKYNNEARNMKRSRNERAHCVKSFAWAMGVKSELWDDW